MKITRFSMLVCAAACVQAIPVSAQQAPAPSSEISKGAERNVPAITRGERIARELGWDYVLKDPTVSGHFLDLTQEHIMSGVYGRSGLTPREREMVIIAIIITQGVGAGLKWHMTEAAHRLGVSEDAFREIIYTSCFYAGWPKCSQAEAMIDDVMSKPNTWPKELVSKNPKARAPKKD